MRCLGSLANAPLLHALSDVHTCTKGGNLMMKRFMILATAALLSSGAFAQTATVDIAPEQRTKIKQYVTTQKVAPVTVKEKVAVGATLPADVRLSPVPADWGPSVSKYQYLYSDNHVYFVEPSSRKVVTVID